MTNPASSTTPESAKPAVPPPSPYPEQPIQTQHSLKIGRKTLNYSVQVGTIPLKNPENGELEANVFYSAYTLNSAQGEQARPLTFAFNGGPGSSSVWLHLGALGPQRVKMLDDGSMPASPYQLVDNPHTWLEFTDLVFVDPVGTGFSRAAKPELNKKFWGVKGDLESMGEFVRLYLNRVGRWASPLFLAGESYGTTRVSGLAGLLVEKGVAFNGILLISSILNFQTARFSIGNDLPYVLFLPTYTATAWYHKKLPAELQKRPLSEVLNEVQEWAITDYTVSLMRGSDLSAGKRAEVVQKLSRYTGLEPRFIENNNMRLEIFRFCKELLREENRAVGRLDSRFKGISALAVSEYPDFDPSFAAIIPPYTAMLNQYLRTNLNCKIDLEYEILNRKVLEGWDWGGANEGFPDTGEMLRSALAKNPHMKVFAALGYYDLATPYFAAEYTFKHMGIDPTVRENLQSAYYEAGHMMYIDVNSLKKMQVDAAKFVRGVV
ncbi:MAG: peptidase S10 [Anaerolineae bacterium]|nr:peptidase S10 [Anaerolineae bacterium]CAG0995056.1 hypothetical protein ANRL4_02714 [Anaerolineae bacterium]